LGGSDVDHGAAIAVDSAGAAYVGGGTYSRDFPTRLPFQAVMHGVGDAFVAKLDSSGLNLVYSTYLGGSSGTAFLPEQANAIAVDSQGDAFLAGVTSSTDFPVASFAAPLTLLGASDAFVAEIDPTGSTLLFSALIGGRGQETATGIALGRTGSVCVTGVSSSFDFPSVVPLQAALAGIWNAFVTVVNPGTATISFSTLLGGSGIDGANGIAVDGSGNIHIVGQAGSADFPVSNGLALTHFGGFDAFAVKIAMTYGPSNVGIFRYGYFWIEDVDGSQGLNIPPDGAFPYGGIAGDIPITGDWNGDGHTKVGIYRSSNGLFILDSNGNGMFDSGDAVFNLGVGSQAGDVPVVGDWNGDGRTKVGIFRQGFFWILDYNGNGVFEQGIDKSFPFGGVSGDVPVVGDWTGTGTSKVGVFRFGYFWILDANGNGTFDGTGPGQDLAFPFGGIQGDIPVVGDWNGTGVSKVGVFRSRFFWVLDANGNHLFDGTGPGQDLAFPFGGIAGDKPVVGKWK